MKKQSAMPKKMTPKKSQSDSPLFAVAGADSFTKAVKYIFGLAEIGRANSSSKTTPVWGVMPRADDIESFCKNWLVLIQQGCRRFVQVTLPGQLGPPSEIKRHPFLKPLLEKADSLEALLKLLAEPNDAQKPNLSESIRLYLEAILLQQKIKRFSHGKESDVVNRFLAPARLLAGRSVDVSPQKQEWKKAWSLFQEIVLETLDEHSGGLAQELRHAGRPISDWIINTNESYDAECLERMMLLLTQIRSLSGQPSERENSQPNDVVEPIATNDEAPDFYRILVADDHAAAWRPVFECFAEKLEVEKQMSVQFEFSLDGKNLAHRGNPPKAVSYGAYDLVILDVFLGDQDGREILRRLRRDFSQLPILLWTTSRSEEMATQASLANGILLKKTVTWGDMMEAVSRCAKRGKAMRTASLPNPFFNHTIQSVANRELAVACHEWCLKQLDSFHALDSEYFRYFTDHGGRHIVKLWELLDQALQPFLYDGTQRLLPEKPAQREIEILGIYLTVIFHELGMFPMRIGNKVENFSTLGKGYLEDVRLLHAVRGMVLLQDRTFSPDREHIGQYWNDARGREIGASLRGPRMDGLADRIAVLVGYHARVFKSMSEAAFLRWKERGAKKKGAKYDLAEKLAKLVSPIPSLSRTAGAFRSAYISLCGKFMDKAVKNRLRRQCALFRFVDALDITASRNPAEFLVGSGSLPAKQHGENLKRELCDSAKIEDGDVRIIMKPPAPNLELIKTIIESVPKLMKKQKDKAVAIAASEFLTKSSTAVQRVTEPWSLGLLSKKTVRAQMSLLQKSALILQKPLDCWLTNVWEVLKGNGGKEAFVIELQDLGVLDPTIQEPTLIPAGAKIIAQITALSVAGELLDEYQAIIEGGLADKIRLTSFTWGSAPDWSKLPKGLPTLENALRKGETA